MKRSYLLFCFLLCSLSATALAKSTTMLSMDATSGRQVVFAADEICRAAKRVKLDDQFSMAGNHMVRPSMAADHEVGKRIAIDEKIEFCRWVMQQAKQETQK